MRTSEERVEELHRRMGKMRQDRSRSQYRRITAAVCAVCLALTILLALAIAGLPVRAADGDSGAATASMFADRPVLGYVVVSVIAFCLGTAATVFCFRLRRQTELENQTTDRNQ